MRTKKAGRIGRALVRATVLSARSPRPGARARAATHSLTHARTRTRTRTRKRRCVVSCCAPSFPAHLSAQCSAWCLAGFWSPRRRCDHAWGWARRCVRASGVPATFPAAWARRPGREVAEHPRNARELMRVSTRRRFRFRLCPRSAAPRVSGLQFRACLPPPAPRRSALCVPLRVQRRVRRWVHAHARERAARAQR